MRHYFKPVLLILGILLFVFGCQKDDIPILEEEAQIESLKAFNMTSKEIPAHILDFVKTKTNNNFGVSIVKNKIKLSSSNVNEFKRETPLGTVQTNKVVQVYNERNTKYTFKVNNPTNANSIINLVVVDMDGEIIEYFIQYIFDDFSSLPRLQSGAIDMSTFTGVMLFYNDIGNIIGTYEITNGVNTNSSGTSDPCNEEAIDYSNAGSNTGGGGGGAPDDEDEEVDNTSNGGSSGSGSGNNETIDQADCGITWSYEPCGCPTGPTDGHEITGNPCCSGSPLVITNTCTGESWSSRYSASNARGSADDPCAGTVGVLIDIEALLEMEQLIEDDPFALIDIDCDQIVHWQTLAQHIPSQSIIDKLTEMDDDTSSTFSDFEIQYIDDAEGAVVNMDYFPVIIDVLPLNLDTNEQYTASEFLDHIRLNINNFVNPEYSSFSLSTVTNDDEEALWLSSNPVETILSIDIPAGHDGSVICSKYNNPVLEDSPGRWIFTTIETPWDFIAQGFDGPHPVSGNREFGFNHNEDGSYTFFTRGIDRFESNLDYNIANYMEAGNPFNGADGLWTSFQTKLQNFVNSNGGVGNAMPQSINRPNWEDVKDVIQGLRPISDLGCTED